MKKTLITSLLMISVATFGVDTNRNKLSKEKVKITSLGVSFNKPNKWFNLNQNAVIENLKKFDTTKENVAEILATTKNSVPVGSFYKSDPRTTPGVIPTINVSINKNTTKTSADFNKMLKSSCYSMSRMLNNFKLIKDLSSTSIGGRQSLYFVAEFDLHAADKSKYHIRSTTYAIPFKDAFIQISMSEESPVSNNKLFSKFIKSFEIKQ